MVADLDADRAAAVAAQLARHGGRFIGQALDVGDAASVMQAVNDARDAFGELDVIVDNAGILHAELRPAGIRVSAIVARVTARCHPEVFA